MGDLPTFRSNVPRLGAGCPRVTQTSATGRLSPARPTCMHEARRKRSSRARIEPIRSAPLFEMPRPLTTVRLLRSASVALATLAHYVNAYPVPPDPSAAPAREGASRSSPRRDLTTDPLAGITRQLRTPCATKKHRHGSATVCQW